MPCPHRDRQEGDDRDDGGGLSRRQMIRAAVAIGGAGGLSACLDREGDATETPEPGTHPTGPEDLSTLPDRQHAWVEWLVRDRFGNTVLPQHQAILLLDYIGPDPPDETARTTVESAFRTLERAFQHGTGGDTSAVQHEGLLFVVGYSPSYFNRFEPSLPESVTLPTPEAVLDELGETDASADDADAVLHLASGLGSILLAAEEALFGGLERINGVPVEGTLEDYFEISQRRTGFFGRAQPAQKYDSEDIPEKAPLSMGFKSSYTDTLATEDRVTIRDGPFSGGTTMQVSRLEHDLEPWYEHDHEGRVHRMYSPEHDPDTVGEVGENLATDSGMTEGIAERVTEDAREKNVVGHGQKLVHARDEDFRQPILRRDFNATEAPGLHFDSWQRDLGDFLDVRKAMNGEHVAADVPDENDGILEFVTVTNRATFLMPPRSYRALPVPQPER